MGMKALFLTYAYPPSRFPRSIQIGHLVAYCRSYYDIQVVASRSEENFDESLLNLTPLDDVVTVPRSRVWNIVEGLDSSALKKAVFYDVICLWARDLYRSVLEKLDNHKIIVSFGQPMSTHLAGLKLKKRFPFIRWVAHFSDPWIDNPFNQYGLITKQINQLYQNAVFKHADRLVFTSQETIDLVMRHYDHETLKKTRYLPHAYNPDFCHKHFQNSDMEFTIRYFGNFYGARQPDSLFEALVSLQKDYPSVCNGIRVELIGQGTGILQKIKEKRLEHIVDYRETINYFDALDIMSRTDLLLVIDAPSEFNVFFPSKLADYIGANRPILGITSQGTSKKIIEELGFVTANPNNVAQVAAKLREMIARVKSGSAMMNQQVRRRYSIEVVGPQMKDILDELIDG